jgi:hypothetical protein
MVPVEIMANKDKTVLHEFGIEPDSCLPDSADTMEIFLHASRLSVTVRKRHFIYNNNKLEKIQIWCDER